MTEPTEAPDMPEREIDFLDRKIWVRLPRPEQLLVWKRTLTQLQGVKDNDWTGETVMIALERLRKIVDSILVNKADVAWIDDCFLEGTLTFQELTPIVTLTVQAFEADGNRQDRRAAKKATPAKKAARKAPAKKATTR